MNKLKLETYKAGDLTKGKLGDFFKSANNCVFGTNLTHKQFGNFRVLSESKVLDNLNDLMLNLCGAYFKIEDKKVSVRLDLLCNQDETTNTDIQCASVIDETSTIHYLMSILNAPNGFYDWMPVDRWAGEVIGSTLEYREPVTFLSTSIHNMENNIKHACPEFLDQYQDATDEQKSGIIHIINWLMMDSMIAINKVIDLESSITNDLNGSNLVEGFDQDIFGEFYSIIIDVFVMNNPFISKVNEDMSFRTIFQDYQDDKDSEGFIQVWPKLNKDA